MPPQWSEPLLNLTLRGGSVYYLQHRHLSSAEPHYFVVLNLTPQDDPFLVLAVSSSNVAGVRMRSRTLPAETLVEISPTDFTDFTVQSIVNCNYWFRVTRQELLQKLQAGLALEQSQMPTPILAKLRLGVLASPLVEDEVKDLLRTKRPTRQA